MIGLLGFGVMGRHLGAICEVDLLRDLRLA